MKSFRGFSFFREQEVAFIFCRSAHMKLFCRSCSTVISYIPNVPANTSFGDFKYALNEMPYKGSEWKDVKEVLLVQLLINGSVSKAKRNIFAIILLYSGALRKETKVDWFSPQFFLTAMQCGFIYVRRGVRWGGTTRIFPKSLCNSSFWKTTILIKAAPLLQTVGREISTSLMSAYYPVVLTSASLIVCFWAEVFHLREIRWDRPR